ERAGQPVHRGAHRLGATLRRSAPHAVLSAGLAALAGPPQARARLASRTGRRARSGADAPVPGQGALSPARHVPGLLPVLYAVVCHRPRHRRGRESAPPPQRRPLASRVQLHRFAPEGPAVMPMKILTDDAWLDALTRVVDKGRKLHKDVVLHTHFNNPNEI